MMIAWSPRAVVRVQACLELAQAAGPSGIGTAIGALPMGVPRALLYEPLELGDAVLPACAAVAEWGLISAFVGVRQGAYLEFGAM